MKKKIIPLSYEENKSQKEQELVIYVKKNFV